MNRMTFLKPVIFVFAVCSFMIGGCNQDDDPIVPSETLSVKYVFPQGNEKYDSLILDFYNENKIFILYEYGAHDPLWNIQSIEGYGIYRIVPPKKESLEAGVNSLFDLWLELYPGEFFVGRLPHYIYLADSIWNGYSNAANLTTSISITFGNINESLQNMTATAKNTFKKNINSAFWNYIIDNGKFEVPVALDLDYSLVTNLTAAYNMGIIHGSTYKLNLQEDFKKTIDYLMSTSQTIINMRFRSYPVCKTRVQLFVSEMKRLYDIDLELLTEKVLMD